MDEILQAVELSAVKAVTTMAVRASVPAWKKVAELSIVERRSIKQLDDWPEIQKYRRLRKRLLKFTQSRTCGSLVDAFAIVYGSGYSTSSSLDRLAQAFMFEFNRAVGVSDPELAQSVWRKLTASVKMGIDQIRHDENFDAGDMILLSRLTEQRGNTSSMTTAINERLSVARDEDRASGALAFVEEARRLSGPAFSEMVMPHARESHRVSIHDLYVARNLLELPPDWNRRKTAHEDESADTISLHETSLEDRRFIVIGNPGAGKSTFVRSLVYATCQRASEDIAPLFVELKSWSSGSGSLISMIASRLESSLQITAPQQAIADSLSMGMAMVVFDGLDEVVDVSERRSLVQAIESFARKYPLARIVISSRQEGYMQAPLNSLMFPLYQIPDFTHDQMCEYARKWFGLVGRIEALDSAEMLTSFLKESVHAADLRLNPLMLSLLCLLYQYEGYIPENRAQVYEDCAELLFGRWDTIRGVRSLVRNDWQGHHLVEELASYFFRKQASQSGEEERVVKALISDYLRRNVVDDEFEVAKRADEFLNHCAGRAWLLTMVGAAKSGQRLFGFTHRTFMEYFAACHMARYAKDAEALADQIRGIVQGGSSEVICQLAIGRFNERNLNGIDDVLRLLLFSSRTLDSRYERIVLGFAARSLEFLQPTPRTVRSILRSCLREFDKSGGDAGRSQIFSVPTKYRTTLEAIAKEALGSQPEDLASHEAKRGAQLYLIQIDKHRGRDARWLATNAPEVLVNKVCSGELSISDYRRFSGSGCLVEFRDRRLDGPLIRAVDESILLGFPSGLLESSFRLSVRDPRALIPMSERGIGNLLRAIEVASDWRQVEIFGARCPVVQQNIQGFAHVCLAMTTESLRLGNHTYAAAACYMGFSTDAIRAGGYSTPDEIAHDIRRVVEQHDLIELNSDWRRYVQRTLTKLKY